MNKNSFFSLALIVSLSVSSVAWAFKTEIDEHIAQKMGQEIYANGAINFLIDWVTGFENCPGVQNEQKKTNNQKIQDATNAINFFVPKKILSVLTTDVHDETSKATQEELNLFGLNPHCTNEKSREFLVIRATNHIIHGKEYISSWKTGTVKIPPRIDPQTGSLETDEEQTLLKRLIQLGKGPDTNPVGIFTGCLTEVNAKNVITQEETGVDYCVPQAIEGFEQRYSNSSKYIIADATACYLDDEEVANGYLEKMKEKFNITVTNTETLLRAIEIAIDKAREKKESQN